MEIEQVEKTRKRRFAYLCAAVIIPLVIAFAIIDFFEGDTVEVWINIFIGFILIAWLLGIQLANADLMIYRSGLVLLCAAFFYNVAIGSEEGTAIYWLFPFPLVFLFFLGEKEGAVASALFIFVLGLILFNPFPFHFYSYPKAISFRFLASLLLVSLVAYGLEVSRGKYGNLFARNQACLHMEKKQLERATDEIKHLSGLLPICSQCKKIRDDAGYWQQVEVYVRDHSEANFSHSICPDCIALLYPEIKKAMER